MLIKIIFFPPPSVHIYAFTSFGAQDDTWKTTFLNYQITASQIQSFWVDVSDCGSQVANLSTTTQSWFYWDYDKMF